MMTKKLKKGLLSLTLAGAGALIFAATALSVSKVSADVELKYETEELKEKYGFREEFTLPGATLVLNGESRSADTRVLCPDGTERSENRFTLDKEGIYTVIYSAVFDGKTETAEKTFRVEKPLYSLMNSASSAEYGSYRAAEHNSSDTLTEGTVTGLKVSLAQGDVFTYNRVVDLTEYTADDLLISFCITPDALGVQDVSSFDVMFTDAYDPSNKVTVNVAATPDGVQYANSYLKAKAEGQRLTGWEWNYNKKHVENSYGYPIRLSFSGMLYKFDAKLTDIADNSFNLWFDYAERALHSKIRQASASSTVICDLDSDADFSTPWEGFKTGECFVSIKASGYSTGTANFVLTKLAGQELSDFSFDGRGIPEVQADTGEYNLNDLPEAVTGYPYPLFPASCVSPYFGELPVETRVYADYGLKTCREIPVTENAFVPNEAGTYTVVYEAKDPFLTAGRYEMNIKAVNMTEEIVFRVEDGEYASSCAAGELLHVGKPRVSGGSGKLAVTAVIEFEGVKTQLEDEFFRPTKAGVYKLTFTAVDYCGQKKRYKIEIDVTAGDRPVFIEPASLPEYFISGAQYTVPLLNAYDFTDGSGSKVPSTITLSDANGLRRVRNQKITPVVKKDGELVTITYTAGIDGKEENSVSYEIPAVIVKDEEDSLHLDKLFYSPDKTVSSVVAGESGLTVSTAKEGALLDFVNPVLAHGFELEFRIPAAAANFNRLSVWLTDSEDKTQSCKLTYERDGRLSRFYVNGERENSFKVGQGFASKDTFRLGYQLLRNELSFDSSDKRTVKLFKTSSGGEFSGFPSGKVYVRIQFEDVFELSELLVVSVNGQLMNDDTVDFIAPRIAVMGDVGGNKKRGEVVVLPKAIACDCVDYNVVFRLTVKAPDGSVVSATDGTRLENVAAEAEYSVRLDCFGSYTVVYEAIDSSSNSTDSGSYILTVVDTQPPVVTVNGKIEDRYEAGKQIVLPSASASDDLSENLTVKIHVVTSKGQVIELKDGAFTPKTSGKYVIRYWCIDEAGNLATSEYTVEVF